MTMPPANTTTDQFMLCSVTFESGGQNEKNIPCALYTIEKTVTGVPNRPILKGPHGICDDGVFNR